jgi:hypothetical protein
MLSPMLRLLKGFWNGTDNHLVLKERLASMTFVIFDVSFNTSPYQGFNYYSD